MNIGMVEEAGVVVPPLVLVEMGASVEASLDSEVLLLKKIELGDFVMEYSLVQVVPWALV